MERSGEELVFDTSTQRDKYILQAARYGIRVSEWDNTVTDEEVTLAQRLDEALAIRREHPLSLEESKLAIKTIKRAIENERRNEGALINYDTMAASRALPELESLTGLVSN